MSNKKGARLFCRSTSETLRKNLNGHVLRLAFDTPDHVTGYQSAGRAGHRRHEQIPHKVKRYPLTRKRKIDAYRQDESCGESTTQNDRHPVLLEETGDDIAFHLVDIPDGVSGEY